MALTAVQVPFVNDYALGVGVDLATLSPMGKVVDGVVTSTTFAEGAKTLFTVERITSTAELEKALGISVEASGGFGCFGASARMDFATRSKVQTSSLCMAITANVELEHISIPDPTLAAPAAELVGRADAFATRYGNMFVRGMSRGGLFSAVMRIDTQSAEDSDSLAMELSGSYGLFSADAKMHFEEASHKYHSEITITVYHEGGPIDLSMSDITDPNQLYIMLQTWLKALQDDPNANAVPYYTTLAPIEIASGPVPPNIAQIEHAQDIVAICARERSMILDGLNLMEYISQNPMRFDFAAPTSVADIVKALNGYQSDLDVVAAAASRAINDVSQAVTPAEFAAQAGKVYPQGIPPSPMPTLQKGMLDALAAKGAALAGQDPRATALRNQQAEGLARRGFDIGMAMAAEDTEDGIGKQKLHDTLSPESQDGYSTAVRYSIDRNRNASLAAAGAAIAAANPVVGKARVVDPSPFYWLGFDIATGIFGDPKLGALGNTASGPGSQGICERLNLDGTNGFNASMQLHLGPPPLPRQA